jgi:hypothetical protein
MANIPYLIPDEDANLNSALVLLIINYLGRTSRGTQLLNNERLLIFMYLLKNPVILDNVLEQVGHREIELTEMEAFSINSISINLDPLFDREWLKSLLIRLAALGCIDATYRKTDGFMYALTTVGFQKVEGINGPYFDRIKDYLKNLEKIKSESTQNINKLINNIFRQ